MVRAEGLEPPRLSSPEPKPGVSANSTTPAIFNPTLKQKRAKADFLYHILNLQRKPYCLLKNNFPFK